MVQLVLFSSLPLIGTAGWFLVNSATEANTNSLAQYASAGAIATEALNSIRTVTSLNMQPYMIEKYRHHLLSAMNIGIFKGFKTGAANGLLFGACFCCYAMAFWYGAKLVAKDIRNDCSSNCTTGGDILACFFSVLMGGIALGQVAPPLGAFTSAVSSAAQMCELIDREPEIDSLSTEGNIPSQPLKGNIVFRNIAFSYPTRPDSRICSDFNLEAEAGQVVALCGSSGSGNLEICLNGY